MSAILSPEPRETAGQSAFEKLPQELKWEIFRYLPEAILQLRETCRDLNSSVHEFVSQASNRALIDEVWLHDDDTCQESQVHLLIAVDDPSRFVLRLCLQKFMPSSCEITKTRDGSKLFFGYTWKSNNPVIVRTAICGLRNCLGKKIGKARFEGVDFRIFSELLEGIQFSRLQLKCRLTDERIRVLNEFMKQHEIDQLKITFSHEFPKVSDPAKMLLDWSSQCRSLHLNQIAIEDGDFDWGPVILEMFSRKMDKLRILSQECVTDESAQFLQEQLPLIDKRVWFEAETYEDSLINFLTTYDYTINEHRITGDRGITALSVKHISRIYEPFELI